ncbi:MAG TPA: helicase-related protein [Kofleriaceae bacterium]|nr:helicase-related protein [Kofleriaceae bacterium]
MDAELRRRVDALRRPLELAAADGFAGVRKVAGLGHALRAACDGVLSKVAGEAISGLDAWRVTLGRWEQLDEQQQAIEVARGMRLLARLPRPPVAPAPIKPTFSLPPLAGPPAPVSRGETVKPVPASRGDAGPPAPVSRAEPTRPVPKSVPVSRAEPTRPKLAPKPVSEPVPEPGSAKQVDAAKLAATQLVAKHESAKQVDAAKPAKRESNQVDAAPCSKPRAPAPPPTAVTDPLAAATNSLPGIGPAFAEKLAEKGLTTVEDLLWMVPRRYDDVRDARSLADVVAMEEGQRATFVARVMSARMVFARGRRWGEVRLGGLDPAPMASALVRWFNVFAGIDKRMPAGCQVALSGIVRKRAGRVELANPDILGIELEASPAGGPEAGGTSAIGGGGAADGARKPMPSIIARYPDVPGVPAGRLRSACASACARVAGSAEDGVPPAIEAAAGLPSLAATLAQLHAPAADTAPDDVAAMNRGDSRWQRRLAFGELFALGVAITLRRRERCADAAVPCAWPVAPFDLGSNLGSSPGSNLGSGPGSGSSSGLEAELARALPFQLTGAQRRSIAELAGDLARPIPMNRLLQGDVGAGKTCVAFAAALQVARAGRQTAVMAPTELLAEQHAETWRGWAQASGLRLELLTASTPRGIRASILALLAAGELDVLIGTHALIAESVGFRALGLVVIDEQHRFGVAQRARLRDKGDGQGAPHLLVMTATPIPRTLALTAYGDLDVSVLDELPPGRTPVATKILTGARGRTAAYQLVADRVAAGERVYIVCPKVAPGEPDADETRTWKDATTVAAEVREALPALRTGLVHGRLDSAARDQVMRAFKTGALDVLVATTVIEVGVDVPAATVMVIHDAERFGLAQLHQLRGRVGRGGGAAHCLLLSQGANGDDAIRRLDAMVATHDGFRIAEQDLALRGPGELLGPKQAGVPRLRYGDLAQHTALLLEARRHAEAVLEADPGLASPVHAALRRALERRLASSVYGAEAG